MLEASRFSPNVDAIRHDARVSAEASGRHVDSFVFLINELREKGVMARDLQTAWRKDTA
jgi:hypothetical protein